MPHPEQGNAAGRGRTASESHLRQGDVKRKGADLLVAPLKLNVRLSKCGPRSVGWLRRLVKRRNLNSLCQLLGSLGGGKCLDDGAELIAQKDTVVGGVEADTVIGHAEIGRAHV